MADAHDDAVVGFRGDFETARKFFADSVETVIAADAKFGGQSFEHAHAAVFYERWFSVHREFEHGELAAERLDHSLQSEADAADGQFNFRGVLDHGGQPRNG